MRTTDCEVCGHMIPLNQEVQTASGEYRHEECAEGMSDHDKLVAQYGTGYAAALGDRSARYDDD